VLDQLSKWMVLGNIRFGETIYVAPFWNWVLTFNPGAAFSFLADQPAAGSAGSFTVLALGVSGWIAFMLRQHPAAKFCSRWR
jgi:signal peptidase II